MSLSAKAIRHHVRALLRDALREHVGERVYLSRTRELWKQELPGVLVYMRRRTGTVAYQGDGRNYALAGELVVEVVVRALDDADDRADEIEQLVLEAIGLDETLGNNAQDCRYAGTDTALDGDGDRQVVANLIRWTVDYELSLPVYRAAPDLELVHTTETIGEEGSPVEEQAIPIDQGPA